MRLSVRVDYDKFVPIIFATMTAGAQAPLA